MLTHYIKRYFSILLLFIPAFLQAQQGPALILEEGTYLQSLCRQKFFVASVNSNIENARYLWLKDGVFFHEGEEQKLLLSQPGIYEVVVTHKEVRFETNKIILEVCTDPKDQEEEKSLTNSYITCPVPVICGPAGSSILQANPTSTGYTYQWYSGTSYSGAFTIISGATGSAYTATQTGYYKVLVNDGVSAPALSNPFEVLKQAQGTLSDLAGNPYSNISTAANTMQQLKVTFTGGEPPYTFYLASSGNTGRQITTNDNPYFFNVSTTQNIRYYIYSLTSACNPTEYGVTTGNISLIVDPTTGFSFSPPPKTNVCAGETIDVPYTTTGTWNNKRSIQLELLDANNNYVPNSVQTGLFTNPLKYTLPQGLIQGNSYKLNAFVVAPYLGSWQQSSYSLTVTSTGCSPRATISAYPSNENCGYVSLNASPNVSGNTYKWFKDNTLISGATTAYYNATQSGNYKVQIENSSTGYNSTSTSTFPISIIGGTPPVITSPNSVICGSNTSVTLTSSITGSANTYQWFYRPNNNNGYAPLIGETSSTLTTTSLGYYKLVVSTTTCNLESNILQVSENPQISLTNTSGTTDPITVSNGNQATIRVNFNGEMPFFFEVYANDGSYTKSFYATSNPQNITLNPQQSGYFYVTGSNSCGNASNSSVLVKVTPEPFFSLPTPSVTTVCAGGRIEIPYNTSGHWGSKRSFIIDMVDLNGNYVSYSSSSSITINNTIFYNLSSSVTPGTYKVRVFSNNPYISNSLVSAYSITVTASGSCSPPSAYITPGQSSECSGQSLNASPVGNFTYTWYKDGVAMGNYASSYFYASSNGTYTVRITDGSGYNSTSPNFVVNGIVFENNSSGISNTSYCDNSTKTLSTTSVSGASYQWYFSPNTLAYTPISGATSNTYTGNQAGSFMVIVNKGGCEQKSYFTCPLVIKSGNQTVCQKSAIEIPINNNYNQDISLKLLNASTLAEVADLGNSYTNGRFLVNIPESVTPGNYRFKLVSSAGSSPPSSGILTVTSGVAPAAPVLTATPSVISGSTSQVINLTASGCSGAVRWVGTDFTSTSNTSTFSISLNQRGTEYKAYCLSSSGCKSATSSVRVNYDCGDLMEPNDNIENAVQISGDSFSTSALCFDYGLDEDWFKTIINGRMYYIRAKRYRSNGNVIASIPYRIVKSLNSGVLTLETLTINPSSYLDTELYLYDQNGSQLAYDDEGNGNGLSKIIYTLPNPCLVATTLTSPLYDVHSNETSVVRAQQITGLNKIENTANATYQAGSSVLLSPGFETKISSSGVFKAEISNCN